MPHERTRRAGSYRLDEEMARGGFGTVYRAAHLATGAHAAVKVLHTELFAEPSFTLRFEREAAVVLALPHPNIVHVHECGRLDDGRPYIAMELLDGESLETRVASAGRLDAKEMLSILEPVASALAAAHARGIVHRDIKPSNVFLAKNRPAGSVVLLDFGIAKLLADQGPALTASRATLGTIPFMAPEQVRGETIDIRADVYALAAVAYAMLTGKAPYGDQVTSVLRQLHLHARPPKPSERAPVDPALDEPLLRALSRDIRERPASAPELVANLRAALGQKPSLRPSSPDISLERPAIAVHAEIRADAAALAEGDEMLLDALEASLPIISTELSAIGLIMLRETATKIFAISLDAPSAPLRDEVVATASRAYRKLKAGPLKSAPLEIGIAVHAGALHTNAAGTLLPSGLLDTSAWVPSALSGVAASAAVLGAQSPREPVAGTDAFFWVER